jgi:hypothetical protein
MPTLQPGSRYFDRLTEEEKARIGTQMSGEEMYRRASSAFGSQRAASEALLAAGIKGIKYLDATSRGKGEGSFNYVIFDAGDVRIEERFAATPQGQATGQAIQTPSVELDNSTASTQVRLWLERLSDLAHVEKALGTPDEASALLLEKLRRGKTADRLQKAKLRFHRPIENAILAAGTEGITLQQLGKYLIARHTRDRNAQIEKINPEMGHEESPGSGFRTTWAEEHMAEVEAGPHAELYRAVARAVSAAIAENRRLIVDYGLESQEMVDKWEAAYGDRYTPLIDAEVADDGHFLAALGLGPGLGEALGIEPKLEAPSGIGRGLDVRGGESKRAMGWGNIAEEKQNQLAEWAIPRVLTQLDRTIFRGEKNRVQQQFYDWVEQNADQLEGAIEIDPAVYRRVIKKKDGKEVVVTEGDPRRFNNDGEWMGVRREGVQHWVHFKGDHKRIGRTMSNLGAQDLKALTRAIGGYTRWMSAMATRWNPVFPFFNALRDAGTAFFNSAEHGAEFAAGVIKGMPPALTALARYYKAQRKGVEFTPQNELEQFLVEYFEDGAPISPFDVNDLGAQMKRMERDVKTLGKPRPFRDWIRKWGDLFGTWSDAVENAARFSFYMKARQELGMKRPRAALEAKRLTTNFEDKGELGHALNSYFMFSNATLQGTRRTAEALAKKESGGHKPVRRMVGGLVALSMSLDFINYLIAGDDDDGQNYWDKVPDYEKRSNLILMWPERFFGDAPLGWRKFKIPAPFVYNIFHTAGQEASRQLRTMMGLGRRDMGEGSLNVLESVLDSTNPLGGGGEMFSAKGIGRTLTPTFADPLLEVLTNEDWAGRPIRPADFPGGMKADADKYWPSVNPQTRAVTTWLNEVTKDPAEVSGWLDFSPETIEHLAKTYTGGLGATSLRAVNLPAKLLAGEEVRVSDVPLMRRIIGEQPPYLAGQQFRGWRDEIKTLASQNRRYLRAGDRDSAAEVRAHPLWRFQGPLKLYLKREEILRERDDQDSLLLLYNQFNKAAWEATK